MRDSMLLSSKRAGRSADRVAHASPRFEPAGRGSDLNGSVFGAFGCHLNLALTGSNQARKGRLVNALAARGDEGRDTLR